MTEDIHDKYKHATSTTKLRNVINVSPLRLTYLDYLPEDWRICKHISVKCINSIITSVSFVDIRNKNCSWLVYYSNGTINAFMFMKNSFLSVWYALHVIKTWNSSSTQPFSLQTRRSNEGPPGSMRGWGWGSVLPYSLKIMPKSPPASQKYFPLLPKIILLVLLKSLKIIHLLSSSPKVFRHAP